MLTNSSDEGLAGYAVLLLWQAGRKLEPQTGELCCTTARSYCATGEIIVSTDADTTQVPAIPACAPSMPLLPHGSERVVAVAGPSRYKNPHGGRRHSDTPFGLVTTVNALIGFIFFT